MSGSANEATPGVAGSHQTFHLIGYSHDRIHRHRHLRVLPAVFIWSKSNWLNFVIKMFFFGMGCGGAFYWFQLAGFIMKV